MGRDVAGLHAERKPSNIFNTGHVRVHVPPRIPTEKNDSKIEEHTGKITENENGLEKQDVVEANNTNYVTTSSLLDPKALKAESIKLEEKKHIIPAVTPASPSIASNPLQSCSYALASKTNDAGIVDVMSLKNSDNTEVPQEISPFVSKKNVIPDVNQFHDDEDDNISLASSTCTSVRSDKYKVTIPIAPKFVCNDRLTKRKEFYSKLEEKHKALEAERLEAAARQKEEEEAAIKELRKSMVPKVNPVPSFYHEGPPPKTELKKLPLTRAKSPKLTRRKSCGDSMKSTHGEKENYDRIKRHNVAVGKEGNNTTPLANRVKDATSSRYSTPPSSIKVNNSLSKTTVTEVGRSKDHGTKKVNKREMSTKDKGQDYSTQRKGINTEEYVADVSVIEETTVKEKHPVGAYIPDVEQDKSSHQNLNIATDQRKNVPDMSIGT